MQLNTDCVRDVLLSVEKLHKIVVEDNYNVTNEPTTFFAICNDLTEFNKEDIYYTISTLSNGGLIMTKEKKSPDEVVYSCDIYGLTYAGHEFVQQIKDDENWSKVKKILKSVRNYSLDAISAVAKGVTSASIEALIAKL